MVRDRDEEWLATEFLKRLRADEASGARRTLADYLAEHPGQEELIAREYVLATAPDAAEEPAPSDRIGPFRLLRELGRGGQGAVQLAEDTRLHRTVALKVLRATGGEANLHFLREAYAAARLQHPGIAAVLEAGAATGVIWIAMQYVPGPTLRQALHESGTLPPRDAVTIAAGMAEALHAAHAQGLVHRDVKPSNVVLGPSGPVLLDFGLAHDRKGELATITTPGELCGTPAYMAPEQLTAGGVLDARTDVWALGVLLFECLTGQLPFTAPSREGTCHAVLHGQLELPRSLPRALRAILGVALQREPARRYASAEAFGRDLRRFLAGEPVLALLPGPLERLQRWARRHAALATALVLGTLSLGGGLALTLALLGRETRERQRAERAFADVRGIARTLAFDVSEALRTVPGATAARHAVLERANELFARLQAEAEADPALNGEVMSALVRLGDVLGHDGTDNLGRSEEAASCYARAAAIAEQRWPQCRSADEFLAALNALSKEIDARIFTDPRGALAAYARVAERARQVCRQFPADLRCQRALAAMLGNSASLAEATGDPQRAARELDESVQAFTRATANQAPQPWREERALAMASYGRLLYRQDRKQEGVSRLRQALAAADEAAGPEPRAAVATIALFLGSILAECGDAQQRREGEAMLARCVDVRRRLRAANPDDVSTALRLASVYFERARLVPSTAAADLAAGLAVCTSLREKLPAHGGLLLLVSRLHALAVELAPEAPASAAHLAAARIAMEELAQAQPRHPELPGHHTWIERLTREHGRK